MQRACLKDQAGFLSSPAKHVLCPHELELLSGDFPSFEASQDLIEVLPASKVFPLDLITGLSEHANIKVPFKLGLQKELSLVVKGLEIVIYHLAMGSESC